MKTYCRHRICGAILQPSKGKTWYQFSLAHGWRHYGPVLVWFSQLPHPGRDHAFLITDGVEIDGSGGHAGVTEPALHEVDGYAATDRMKPEAMTQAFWRRMRAVGYPRVAHDAFDQRPCSASR